MCGRKAGNDQSTVPVTPTQSSRPNGMKYFTAPIPMFQSTSNVAPIDRTPPQKHLGMNFNTINTMPTMKAISTDNFITDYRLSFNLTTAGSISSDDITELSEPCGVIGYCTNSAYNLCRNTPLNTCEHCSQTGAALFLLFTIIMGFAILAGNSIIVAVGVHRHRKGKENKLDICRSSLAAADSLAGIQILVVTMYNYSWSTRLTSLELDREQLALRGSMQAIFGATLYLFGFSSSIFHLLYMSLQRLYAILLPIRYKLQKKKSLYIGLGVVWMFSLFIATAPAWFSQYLVSEYLIAAFLYQHSLQEIVNDQDYTPLAILTIGGFAVPYCLMTLTTIACGLLIRWYYVKKTRNLRDGRDNSNVLTKQKVNAFKTVAIMQLGFTITLVPLLVVTLLFYAQSLDCSTISKPYLICLYLAMSNSLVNVIVYSIRDPNFRSSVRDLLSGILPFSLPF